MTATDTFICVERLFSLALIFQSTEMIRIFKNETFVKVWSLKNIENTLAKSLPFSEKIRRAIFSEKIFFKLLYLQLFLIAASLFVFHPLVIFIVALIQILICMRFRGNFNGGSDMMTFVVATGLVIGGKFGLIYIAIHSCYSYFKAGLVKIKNSEWRTGRALSEFLKFSLYRDIQLLRSELIKHSLLEIGLNWLTLIFELSLPLIFIFPKIAWIYMIVAIIFHFTVYLLFGLNRFFWIWLTTWPAILFTVGSIKS